MFQKNSILLLQSSDNTPKNNVANPPLIALTRFLNLQIPHGKSFLRTERIVLTPIPLYQSKALHHINTNKMGFLFSDSSHRRQFKLLSNYLKKLTAHDGNIRREKVESWGGKADCSVSFVGTPTAKVKNIPFMALGKKFCGAQGNEYRIR